MEQKVILIYGKPYNFPDKETGEIKEGLTLQYILTDNLKANKDDITYGYMPVKVSMPLKQQENIVSIPGLYNMEFTMAATSKGAVLKPTNLKYIKDLA